VYIREAHPDSVLYFVKDGQESLAKVVQTETLAERGDAAEVCCATLKLSLPAVLDREDNRVNQAYAGWPDRFVVVGVDGRVAYYGRPGPAGFRPEEVEDWLKANTP
jgi:type I thyroxine 5'-deiodinase